MNPLPQEDNVVLYFRGGPDIVRQNVMNKAAILKKIIAHLSDKIALHTVAARAAHAEATHEESKAEDKYDTRGLEASYLAAGQSRQLAETAAALDQFMQLKPRAFSASDAIDLGALVTVETKTETMHYFIGPGAGGVEVVHEKKTVLVITPQSPLGRQLAGKKQGESIRMKIGGFANELRIVAVA